jgi:restriction system protein
MLLLTLLWLPSLAVAWLIMRGTWPVEGSAAYPTQLLLLMVAVHTLVLLGGWIFLGWRVQSRQADANRGHAVTLDQLRAGSPEDFERWVQGFFERQGYFVDNRRNSGDHGVDLRVVAPDGEPAIVQCKRYDGTVGEPVLRDLFGAMQHEEVPRAFVVTTGRFSGAAQAWARGKPIELIDGERLVRLAGLADTSRP